MKDFHGWFIEKLFVTVELNIGKFISEQELFEEKVNIYKNKPKYTEDWAIPRSKYVS